LRRTAGRSAWSGPVPPRCFWRGYAGAGEIAPGRETVYEFDAEPFGLHLYHCHVRPLAQHIAKGLYGAFIIDPKDGRDDAEELVMVMNGFDTNFDRSNEVYAVNTVGFAYMDRPVRVRRDEGGARLVPVERTGKEMRIELGDLGQAGDGDLVEVEVKLTGRMMIPKARVINVIGNPRSEKAISMIAIHSLEIPYRFPARVLQEAEEAGEADLKGQKIIGKVTKKRRKIFNHHRPQSQLRN